MLMAALTHRQVKELADILQGTSRAIQSGLATMNLEDEDYDVTDIEDDLLDYIEMCQGCDCWCEPWELAGDEDDEPGYCDQCRESGHGES